MKSLLPNISLGESQTVEFKFEINDARKIAETISAFSNTDGGSIFIGVKDNGSIAGVRSDEEYYMIENAAQSYCIPEILFKSITHKISGKEILEIQIPESNLKPVFAKTSTEKRIAFFRKDAANYVANAVMLEVWKNNLHLKKTVGYTKDEEIVLHLFNLDTKLTLSKIANSSKIDYKNCIKTVAQLVIWNLLETNIQQGIIYYQLSK